MAVRFTSSADKHGIPHEDAIHAMLHADGMQEVAGRSGNTTMVYVGLPHPQALRHIEVIAWMEPPATVVIFHVMEVSDLYRHLIESEED